MEAVYHWTWWHLPLIQHSGGRGGWISEFKSIHVYRSSSRTVRATQRNCLQKRKEGRKERRKEGRKEVSKEGRKEGKKEGGKEGKKEQLKLPTIIR